MTIYHFDAIAREGFFTNFARQGLARQDEARIFYETTTKNNEAKTMKSVLICTEYRGVFYGEVESDVDLTSRTLTNIKNCRMAINWRNGKGVMGLASDGPDDKCKIGSTADVEVMHGITAIFAVTPEAREKWITA